MKRLYAAFSAAFFVLLSASTGSAQDVTLKSRDGSVEIAGTMLGFDGEFYRLQTVYGELTVDGSGVDCEGPGCPNLEAYVAELFLSGSHTIARVLMPALIEVFAQNAGLSVQRTSREDDLMTFSFTETETEKLVGRFYLRSTNTDEGFADLLSDEADLVLARRSVRQVESDRAAEIGLSGLQSRARVLALDALVPIVSPGNRVQQVGVEQLSQILSGAINNWTDLGGEDAPITVYLPVKEAGLWQQIQDRLLSPVGATAVTAAIRLADDEAIARAVEKDPFGLAVTSMTATGNAKALALSGTCGFSLEASRRTIKTEDYPLTAPMLLYVPPRRLPKLARDFLTFTRSQSAQVVIRRAGFTDQTIEEIAVGEQGNRLLNAMTQAGPEIGLTDLTEMAGHMSGRQRLSMSFRFETGSTRLDAQSQSNVAYMAQLLESGTFDTRSLSFVGFSDGDGSAEANKAIALRRAVAVMNAVTSAAETAHLERIDLSAKGFGEVMPMACDDSAWGRQVNRRVEIWVR